MASSTAPLSAEILANWSLDIEAVLTQILLVVLVGVFLALGLLARSRAAFGLGFAIGLAAVAWWLDLVVSKDPVALHRLAVLIGASGLLVITGLLLELPAFWQRPTADPADSTSVNPRRAADRAWRPPR